MLVIIWLAMKILKTDDNEKWTSFFQMRVWNIGHEVQNRESFLTDPLFMRKWNKKNQPCRTSDFPKKRAHQIRKRTTKNVSTFNHFLVCVKASLFPSTICDGKTWWMKTATTNKIKSVPAGKRSPGRNECAVADLPGRKHEYEHQ